MSSSHSQQVGETSAPGYLRREVARLLNIDPRKLRGWERAGIVNPEAQDGLRYSFADLVSARAAKALVDQGVSVRRLELGLRALGSSDSGMRNPLSECRFVADGKRVLVQRDAVLFEPDSGQVVLDFKAGTSQQVVHLEKRQKAAYEHYLRGCELDDEDVTLHLAETAYRKALELQPNLAIAMTNLANLRYRTGDIEEAERLFIKALETDSEQPEAAYNYGVLLYERGEIESCLPYFFRAVELDPGFSDAYFNLAMVLETLGRSDEARRFWKSYIEIDPQGEWASIAAWHLTKQPLQEA